MPVNLTDWLGDNAWALWLSLALLLGIAELFTLNLVLVMLAVGALAGAATAAIAPGLWWLQILVAVVVAVATLLLLRPALIEKVRAMPGYRSALDKMVGSSGWAVSQITGQGGEVKIGGQSWSARAYDGGATIPSGTEVEVYEVDGTTAVVYPKHGQLP